MALTHYNFTVHMIFTQSKEDRDDQRRLPRVLILLDQINPGLDLTDLAFKLIIYLKKIIN